MRECAFKRVVEAERIAITAVCLCVFCYFALLLRLSPHHLRIHRNKCLQAIANTHKVCGYKAENRPWTISRQSTNWEGWRKNTQRNPACWVWKRSSGLASRLIEVEEDSGTTVTLWCGVATNGTVLTFVSRTNDPLARRDSGKLAEKSFTVFYPYLQVKPAKF